jgi:hypothetical protein
MRPDNPIRNFDPRALARYEKENYVAYYQKDWLKLLRVSVGLVKQSFGLNWLQAAYAAYLVARAEIAFAPFPDNDIPKAEAFMQRFYRFIQRVHREDFDVVRAAQLEVNWWIVHRKLFGNDQNRELVEAVRDLYAAAYGVESPRLERAAALRVQGMLYSDLWVNAGKPADSPLLNQEEEALYQGYAALKQAINQ